MDDALLTSDLPGLPPPKRGKVRDVYDLGDELLIVATDRISAYDHVLKPGIPGKGKILTQLSNFWFEELAGISPHHLLATDVRDFPASLALHAEVLAGRSVLVRKTAVVPFECVARGFLAGSGFRDYTATGEVCGLPLPPGLVRADRLPEPLYTPATKAETGHDENVGIAVLEEALGAEMANRLKDLTLDLYSTGAAHAEECGIILADTKFEFGMVGDELILIDEALTPDSSRFWEKSAWTPGTEPISLDKQFVRNWLDGAGWDHEAPAPVLPAEVVQGTLDRYIEAFERLTGRQPEL
jgi:phosphoribosylaminoimidazole-succinocarboxamide synthase